jgi:hypothetical protein
MMRVMKEQYVRFIRKSTVLSYAPDEFVIVPFMDEHEVCST